MTNHGILSLKHVIILAVLLVPIIFVSRWVSKETAKITPVMIETPKEPEAAVISEPAPQPPAAVPVSEPEATELPAPTTTVEVPSNKEKEIIYEKPLDDVFLVQ